MFVCKLSVYVMFVCMQCKLGMYVCMYVCICVLEFFKTKKLRWSTLVPSEATRDSDWFKFTTKRQADIIAWEEIEKGEDIATDVSQDIPRARTAGFGSGRGSKSQRFLFQNL